MKWSTVSEQFLYNCEFVWFSLFHVILSKCYYCYFLLWTVIFDCKKVYIPYMAKTCEWEIFVVRIQNGHLWKNFHSCMLVLIVDIADRWGYVTPTCCHFSYCSRTAAYCTTNAFWVGVTFRYGEHLPSVQGIVLI